MSFMERVIAERRRLDGTDFDWGYWDDLIAVPLPTERQNIYEGDLGMDQATAERIATALEQIALELYTGNGSQKPMTVQPQNAPLQLPPAHQPVQVGNPGVSTLACPVHGVAWRQNSRGGYCATRLADGSWCSQKP